MIYCRNKSGSKKPGQNFRFQKQKDRSLWVANMLKEKKKPKNLYVFLTYI